MPHPLPKKRLQAIILCGPGVSFTTFASNPDEFPKALIPIANRPMVWYPLDLCRRMGIDDVSLIVPRSSEGSIFRSLETDAHLSSLPKTPKLVAPKELEQTTGTAAIFRLQEVRDIIRGDFIVLPCDLVVELNGRALLDTWMVQQPWLDIANLTETRKEESSHGARGGFTMWYDTKGENPIKGEETDFLMTTPFERRSLHHKGNILTSTSKLVYSMPTDTLNDTTEENQGALPLRHGLLGKHPRLKMFTQHRDAHFYIFPQWIVDFINTNEHMDSLSEDVIGWWAKAEWQHGLGDKLGLRNILGGVSSSKSESGATGEDWRKDLDQAASQHSSQTSVPDAKNDTKNQLVVPPIIAYVHPSYVGTPLVRRVDTAPLLLSTSLKLAKLGSIDEVGQDEASPFAHQNKIGAKTKIPQKCSVSRSDCLIGYNVSIEEKTSIKESVVGSHSKIHESAKLIKCVLMDGAIVGKGCRLTNCILGRKAEIGEYSTLTDCEVQDGHKVEARTEEKNEKIMSSAGLEVDNEELGNSDDEDQASDHEADD